MDKDEREQEEKKKKEKDIYNEIVRQIFNKFDVDQSGAIDRDEAVLFINEVINEIIKENFDFI